LGGCGLRLFALLLFLFAAGCGRQAEPTAMTVQQLLGNPPAEGFLRATKPRAFTFPADHGPHPGFRDEWWYVTGNLTGEGGERFGFQFTLFRHQLRPDAGGEGWQRAEVWLGHFAISELDSGRYHFFERYGRAGAGVAGAQTQPFAVWLDGWRLTSAADGFAPLHLSAAAGAVALDLTLSPTLKPVLQGEHGLSQKSAEAGNASYYYSMPRIEARGELRDGDGHRHAVSGLAWLDREWSSSALGAGQVGWDWFSLQLTDGRSLMLYQLRREDGAVDRHSSASLIGTDGGSTPLGAADFTLTPERHWHGPDGERYPVRWRLRIPGQGIDWLIAAPQPAQLFDGSVRYWEGAVEVISGTATIGRGYLEMTGY
jgi:predicted secreted hydrolase